MFNNDAIILSMEDEQYYINELKNFPDFSLANVPLECRNLTICLEAVKSRGNNLKYVPYKSRTKKICLAALRSNPLILQYVPKKLKKKEVEVVYYLRKLKEPKISKIPEIYYEARYANDINFKNYRICVEENQNSNDNNGDK